LNERMNELRTFLKDHECALGLLEGREVQERQQAAPFSTATGGAKCLPRSFERAASTSAAHYYCCPLATINHMHTSE